MFIMQISSSYEYIYTHAQKTAKKCNTHCEEYLAVKKRISDGNAPVEEGLRVWSTRGNAREARLYLHAHSPVKLQALRN